MALTFHPRAGQIFMCDFSGFREPEMIKPRPVIVVSPKLPYRSNIVAIVPISLTEPRHRLPDDLPCWAKADMLMNLGIYRLTGFKVGRRQYVYPTLAQEDLAGVRHAVLCGLGLDAVEKIN
jgi:uncharacterized protein YifN (PemK superfamily)